MPDPQGAVPGATPQPTPPSPGANGNNGAGATPAVVPPAVPFDRDPKIQEYVSRQVIKAREEERVLTMGQIASFMDGRKPQTDPIKEHAVKMAARYKITEEEAAALLEDTTTAAEARIAPRIQQLEGHFAQQALNAKFAAVFQSDPDLLKDKDKIMGVFTNMNEIERSFVLQSPDGPKHLVSKYREVYQINPSNKSAAGAIPGSGTDFNAKAPAKNVYLELAGKALSERNGKAYAEAMANYHASTRTGG